MDVKKFSCPSCGAPADFKHSLSSTIVCDYCGQTLYLESGSLQMEGKMKNLEPAFSIFKLSARGKLKDNKLDSFKIIGHVRYNYGGELWDEWSAVFGDLTQGWIAEREGQCFLFTKGKMTAKLADIERLRVGNTIKIDNHPIFITQIRQATLVGGEGEFSYRITPDSVSKHLHGISEGKPVFIEIAPKYLKFHLGTNLDYKQIELIK